MTTKKTKLPAKANRENARRKRQAREVLAHYADMTGQEEEDNGSLLGDLLADCLHLMGKESVSRCIFTAAQHYEAEARGED